MSRQISLRGLATVLGLAGTIASCTPPGTDLIAPSAARGGTFDNYVAIGNSITAGYQSGGIVDSTQKRSYAFLLAQSMGTRFAYPSIAGRGCPPLIASFLTQARTTGTAATCDLRSGGTDVLNNVAVPGAWSPDPSVASSANSNALTTIFLGGKTQVQKALDAHPTFVSIWIGNNDLLGPAVSNGGTSALGPASSLNAITTQTAFQANIAAITGPLMTQNPQLKGVLIGVVNVANAPVMFPAAAMLSAAFKAGFDAIACGAASSPCFGTTTTLDGSCATAPGNTALINMFLAFQIRLGQYRIIATGTPTATIACKPGGASGLLAAPIGDALILDPTEQTTVTTAVNGYNAYLQAKADSLGFAFYDPNPTLVLLRTANAVVRNIPNLASGTTTFGTGMSNDGVHPAAAIHLQIANEIIKVINTKYSITLPNVF